jgi:hypothetical protein
MITPAFGFSAPDLDYPLVAHARGFAAHLVFGLAVAVTFLQGGLGGHPPPTPTSAETSLEERQLSDHVDVIVIGMGPGGEVAAGRLLAGGKRVAVVERELIGGECAYWACIPSKTVLRRTRGRHRGRRAAGSAGHDATGPPPATTGTT